jgi:hypothetical protein
VCEKHSNYFKILPIFPAIQSERIPSVEMVNVNVKEEIDESSSRGGGVECDDEPSTSTAAFERHRICHEAETQTE